MALAHFFYSVGVSLVLNEIKIDPQFAVVYCCSSGAGMEYGKQTAVVAATHRFVSFPRELGGRGVGWCSSRLRRV